MGRSMPFHSDGQADKAHYGLSITGAKLSAVPRELNPVIAARPHELLAQEWGGKA